MNQKKAKWLKRMVSLKNPVLLLLIRNKFGESTQGMGYNQLYTKAKYLYKKGEIQKIKDWPTVKQMRNMKGAVAFDESFANAAGKTK